MAKKYKLTPQGLDFSGSGAGSPEGSMIRARNVFVRRNGELWGFGSNNRFGVGSYTGDQPWIFAMSPVWWAQSSGSRINRNILVGVDIDTSSPVAPGNNGLFVIKDTDFSTNIPWFNFLGLSAGDNSSWTSESINLIYNDNTVATHLRMPLYTARGNLYCMTADGLLKLPQDADTTFHHVMDALVLPPLNSVNDTTTATNNWLEDGNHVAYRTVLVLKDDSGVIRRSAPSTPFVIANSSGGGRAPRLWSVIASRHMISTAAFTKPGAELHSIELYRGSQVAQSITPPQDFALVAAITEKDLDTDDSDDLWAYVLYADDVPEDERGAFLYTNDDEGSANMAPPAAMAHAHYAGHEFWGNVAERAVSQEIRLNVDPGSSTMDHSITLTMASSATMGTVSSATDLELGMFIWHSTCYPNGAYVTAISGTDITMSVAAADGTFAAGAATTFYSCLFVKWPDDSTDRMPLAFFSQQGAGSEGKSAYGATLIVTGGSYAELVETAPYPLAFRIAELARTGFHRFLTGDKPMFWANNTQAFDGEVASLNTAAGAPTSGGTEFDSDNLWPGRIYFSKRQEPEVTTAFSYFDVGEPQRKILALKATRDALFVIKEDGVWRVTGSNFNAAGNFRVDAFDTGIRPLGDHYSWSVLGDEIYGITNTGPVAISSRGVRRIGDKINHLLRDVPWIEYYVEGGNPTQPILPEMESYIQQDRHHPLIGVQADPSTNEVYWTLPYENATTNNGFAELILVFNANTGAWTTLAPENVSDPIASGAYAVGALGLGHDGTSPDRGEGIVFAGESAYKISGRMLTGSSDDMWDTDAGEATDTRSQAYWRVDYADDPTGFKKWMYADFLWRPVYSSGDFPLPKNFAAIFYPGSMEWRLIDGRTTTKLYGSPAYPLDGGAQVDPFGAHEIYVDCNTDWTGGSSQGNVFRVLVPQELAREPSLIVGVRWPGGGSLLGCSLSYVDGGDRVSDGGGGALQTEPS